MENEFWDFRLNTPVDTINYFIVIGQLDKISTNLKGYYILIKRSHCFKFPLF